MSDYKFTGENPRIMTGLVQGVNALVSGETASPYGSTVLCLRGDTLHTDAPYNHAELVPLEDTPPFDSGAELPPGSGVVTNDTGTPETLTDKEPTA